MMAHFVSTWVRWMPSGDAGVDDLDIHVSCGRDAAAIVESTIVTLPARPAIATERWRSVHFVEWFCGCGLRQDGLPRLMPSLELRSEPSEDRPGARRAVVTGQIEVNLGTTGEMIS